MFIILVISFICSFICSTGELASDVDGSSIGEGPSDLLLVRIGLRVMSLDRPFLPLCLLLGAMLTDGNFYLGLVKLKRKYVRLLES